MKNKGALISFMGIKPKPGKYWTTNRHNCLGQSQIHVVIYLDGAIITECPCCGGNPLVFYDCGQFFYYPEDHVIGI